jgi:hypothetical protein
MKCQPKFLIQNSNFLYLAPEVGEVCSARVPFERIAADLTCSLELLPIYLLNAVFVSVSIVIKLIQ